MLLRENARPGHSASNYTSLYETPRSLPHGGALTCVVRLQDAGPLHLPTTSDTAVLLGFVQKYLDQPLLVDDTVTQLPPLGTLA
jgi:hypothetical protein